MKRKCTNCAFCESFKYFQTDKTEMMRCWHETDVCDHAFVISMVRAEKYKCDNHRFQNERDEELFEEAKLEYENHKKAVEKLEKKYPQLKKLNGHSETPNDLEEAAENYIAPIENDEGLDYINFNGRDIKDAFIAGAEWQAEKDARDMYMSDNRHFEKVYELGKKDMKKQMMEGAVEAVVTTNLANRPIIYLDQLQGFQYGDKVRVIVIKEDEL